jgi:HEAT repeat protein
MRRLFTGAFAAILALGPPPFVASAAAQIVSGVPAVSEGVAGAAAAGPSASNFGSGILAPSLPTVGKSATLDFVALFPALHESAHEAETVGALHRILAQQQVSIADLIAAPAAEQTARIQSAVEQYAKAVVAQTTARNEPPADPVHALVQLNALKHRCEDASSALKLVGPDVPRDLDRDLELQLANIRSELVVRGDELTAQVLSSLSDERSEGAVWHGRTAVVRLRDNGGAIALKFATPEKKVDHEGPLMDKASRFGITAPIALPGRDGYVRSVDSESPVRRYGQAFVAYALPAELHEEFFSYLGDVLPENWSRRKKTDALGTAAARAVDGIIRLADNGWAHVTLAPLSHSEASWRWDFWRNTSRETIFEIPRFGPTAIHDWNSALSHANVRLSGLADFEHMRVFDETLTPAKMIGQNIFELSLLAALGGYRNGISPSTIAKMLARTFQHFSDSRASGRQIQIEGGTLIPLLKNVIRRLYAFFFLSRFLPRPIARHFNRWVSSISASAVPENEPLVMSGELVHSLVMDIVKPFVEIVEGVELEGRVPPGGYSNQPSKSLKSAGEAGPSKFLAERRRMKDALSRLGRAFVPVILPVQVLLFGFETAAYFGRLGEYRRPWIWKGDDGDVLLRRKAARDLKGRLDPAALTLIEKSLNDPDAGVRQLAAAALAGRRDPESLPLIEKALADADGDVRRRAAEVLAVRHDPESLPLVEEALARGDVDVRRSAVLSLGSRVGPEARLLLERALADEDEAVRVSATRVFIGWDDSDAVHLVETLLKSPNVEIRGLAAGRMGELQQSLSLKTLFAALDDGDWFVRTRALFVLRNRSGAEVLPRLRRAMGDVEFEVRRAAVFALSGRSDDQSLTYVGEALGDEDHRVRIAAVEALGACNDARSLTMLERVLSDPDDEIWKSAFAALLKRHDAFADGFISHELKSTDKAVRLAAAKSMLPSRDESDSALALFSTAANDVDAQVREAAFRAMAYRKGSGFVVLIEKGLSDEDAAVRSAAAYVLQYTDAAYSMPLMRKALRSPDWFARKAAVVVLPFRADRQLSLPLLERALSDPDVRVRRAVAVRLRGSADPENLELIAQVLKDPEASVRVEGVLALREYSGRRARRLLKKAKRDIDGSVREAASKP